MEPCVCAPIVHPLCTTMHHGALLVHPLCTADDLAKKGTHLPVQEGRLEEPLSITIVGGEAVTLAQTCMTVAHWVHGMCTMVLHGILGYCLFCLLVCHMPRSGDTLSGRVRVTLNRVSDPNTEARDVKGY